MKRKRRTHRKKSGGLSGHTRRRSHRKSGLFEGMLSGSNLKSSAINVALGALGGSGASVGMKLIQGVTKGNIFANILSGAVVGFVASSLGAPKIGIGFSGGITALALQGGLKDNAEFADDDVLEEGEVYQTESGEYVKMLNDGSMQYLSADEAQYLMEGEVYPSYGTMNTFQN